MRKARNIFLLVLLGIALLVGWPMLMDLIWPPRPKPDSPMVKIGKQTAEEGASIQLRESDLSVSAFGIEVATDAAVHLDVRLMRKEFASELTSILRVLNSLGGKPVEVAKVDAEVAPKPVDTVELIPLGRGANPYYLQLLLNARGGSVQEVILTAFDEADREGREVVKNGKPVPLRLVPGLIARRASSLRGQRAVNELVPELPSGKVAPSEYDTDDYRFARPSYVMFHYDKPGDDRPVDLLGIRDWKIVDRNTDENADEQYVVFQTELGDPHNLIIRKTYSLKRREYHIGMVVDIERIPGKAGDNRFRYQIQGAHGLPIEGEWYTSTYHQIIVGLSDDKGKRGRYVEDASTIREWSGSERQTRGERSIRYAATTVQYFASAIAVDDQQENRRFIEHVRATPWAAPSFDKKEPNKDPIARGQEFLSDATVRTITEEFDPGKGVTHKYLLYQGPVKVRLLKHLKKMKSGMEVDDALVDRYLDKITLDTMTDQHMPNALGRFANAIYWTDLVVGFTNLIHSLLYYLYHLVPNLGVCIILLTIIVRGMLFPLSRRQSYNAQVMQQKMAKIQPELRKIQEKYKDDFHKMNQERMKLYKDHGINPFAMLGGCLVLLLQMPVFIGLYNTLQESVFFRLYEFVWMPNLAAPDMMVRWGEGIPFISTPEDIGSMLYLGPYFNILPIVAVFLMLYQQKKMMPVSDDPQVQAQQRMMKFMMILFGLFFYKMAAGLCIYFVVSSLWGLAERRFMPKIKPEDEQDGAEAQKKDEPPKPLGWWGRKKARWREKWKKILEEAQKQAEYRRERNQKRQGQSPPGSPSPPAPTPGRGGTRKRKKKR